MNTRGRRKTLQINTFGERAAYYVQQQTNKHSVVLRRCRFDAAETDRMQLEAAITAPRRRNRKPKPPRITPDGRTRDVRRHRAITGELSRMIGGVPDAGQRLLIETAATLTLSIEALSRAQQRGEAIDQAYLLKLSSQLNRTLASLRREAPKASPPQWTPSRGRLARSLAQGGASSG